VPGEWRPSERLTFKQLECAIERMRQAIPVLANAAKGPSRPDFALEIGSEIAERGRASASITDFSLLTTPGFASSDAIVHAKLLRSDGSVV